MNYSRQRKVIARIVRESKNHPTAEEVYDKARREIPTIGLATVYRNLKFLADRGEIIKIEQPGAVDRFDGTTEKHCHMACPVCGHLTDLYADGGDINGLLDEIRVVFGIDDDQEIQLEDVLLEGLCDKCRQDAGDA